MLHGVRKECQEIIIDQNDKIVLILRKNLEAAIDAKEKAVLRIPVVKKLLTIDHSMNSIKEFAMIRLSTIRKHQTNHLIKNLNRNQDETIEGTHKSNIV